MVAELNLLEVWIPEQMQPGTIVSAGAGGGAGQGGESLLGGAGVSFVRIAGSDYETAVRGAGGDDLRIVGVLGGVFSGGSDDSVSPGELIGLGRRLCVGV